MPAFLGGTDSNRGGSRQQARRRCFLLVVGNFSRDGLAPIARSPERIAALHVIQPRADRPRPITLGAAKPYDLCGPATLTITAQGGEMAFGALEAPPICPKTSST
jgi:hypothetical protein